MKESVGFFVILLAFTLGACSVKTSRPPAPSASAPASPKALALLKKGETELKAGQLNKARNSFKQAHQSGAGTDASHEALYALGQLEVSAQNYSAAWDAFRPIVESSVESSAEHPRALDATYWGGRCLYQLERGAEALPLLTRAQASEAWGESALQMVFEIHRRDRQYSAALTSLFELLARLPAEQRTRWVTQGSSLVERDVPAEQLPDIASSDLHDEWRGYAWFRLGQSAMEQGDFSEAQECFANVIQVVPATDLALNAQTLLAQLDARDTADAQTIGVILPLSGTHANLGYDTLMGIQLALGLFNDPSSPFKLAIVDSQEDVELAKAAVEQLVVRDQAIAIIGSLSSKTADAVAKKAQDLGVPSISLAQRAQITGIGPLVFRHALTGEAQVRHLVNTAMFQLGLKRFAVLFPNDPYGIEYANLFWDAVSARGGQVASAQTYEPGETDFNKHIQRMVGTYYSEDRKEEYLHRLREWENENPRAHGRSQPPKDLLPPLTDFEAVFVPDSTKALGQIAPMLKYNDVDNVYLLGSNLWNQRSLLQRQRGATDHLLFVDSAVSTPADIQTLAITQTYTDIFAKPPSAFSVRGYDVANILRVLIENGAKTRPELTAALNQLKDFPGLSGPLSTNSQREIQAPLVAFTLKQQGAEAVVEKLPPPPASSP